MIGPRFLVSLPLRFLTSLRCFLDAITAELIKRESIAADFFTVCECGLLTPAAVKPDMACLCIYLCERENRGSKWPIQIKIM
jgi:hypothetical protein